MSDAEDNNGASGGAGENPEEEEEALVEGMDTLTLEHSRVYLKLETTGFEPKIYITEIKTQCDEDAFGTFVRPPSSIESIAENKSGITYNGNQMYFRGKAVESVCIKEALKQFLQFLRKFGNQPVVIVGHNIKRYGCYHLLKAVEACDMADRLRAATHGFVDTCILFQNRTQDRKSPTSEGSKHTIEALYKQYFPQAGPYDPSEGARTLRNIVVEAHISDKTFQQNFFSFGYFECRFSWKPLEKGNVINDYILKKVANRKFHFDTVKKAFAEGGEERAKEVLQQPMEDGKPMVTNDQSRLEKICRYLRESP